MPNKNTPANINSLQFRSSLAGFEGPAGGGYLFDNVTVTTSNGPGPVGCPGDDEPPPDDVDIEKTTDARDARAGDLITYRLNVTNHGDAPAAGLQACDVPSRALAFVHARVRLIRTTGRRRCLSLPLLQPGQSKAFSATFRLRADVAADTVRNGAVLDAILGSEPSALPPEGITSPPSAARIRPRRLRLARDAAVVRVLRARACPAAANPRAHAAC